MWLKRLSRQGSRRRQDKVIDTQNSSSSFDISMDTQSQSPARDMACDCPCADPAKMVQLCMPTDWVRNRCICRLCGPIDSVSGFRRCTVEFQADLVMFFTNQYSFCNQCLEQESNQMIADQQRRIVEKFKDEQRQDRIRKAVRHRREENNKIRERSRSRDGSNP